MISINLSRREWLKCSVPPAGLNPVMMARHNRYWVTAFDTVISQQRKTCPKYVHYETNLKQEGRLITTSIKLSIEVENGDETEKDEFLNTISHLYHYEFVKENSGYGNKRYLQYLLTPAVHHSCGRKRKQNPLVRNRRIAKSLGRI